MEWTRKKLMIALAMSDQLTSKMSWEIYQKLLENELTTETFELEDIHLLLTTEQLEWLQQTNFVELEQRYRKARVHFLMIEDANYPNRLREIYQPPVVLFYQGDLSLLNQLSLAVVGSRHHSAYSSQSLELLIPKLVQQKVAIISGLARGVDTLAHQLTIQHAGKTIAVIGSGLDIYYPKENTLLYQEIAKKGLILSEYPLGSQPLKFHFPYRNRIIAGLCHGVCVSEAKLHSGSLITANLALSENRVVYAIPGMITSEFSRGTNALLTAGAIPATSSEDILQNLVYFP